MRLPASTIAQLAAAAGFSGNDLTVATAVALAESGGDPHAHPPAFTNEDSRGLWQIYMLAHPEFAGADLYDPQINAAAAFRVYAAAGNSFYPWSAWKNGSYKRYMASAQAATPPEVIDPGPAEILPPEADQPAQNISVVQGQIPVPGWVLIAFAVLGFVVLTDRS